MRKFILCFVFSGLTVSAFAGAQRPYLVRENEFPADKMPEVSVEAMFIEYGDINEDIVLGDYNASIVAAELRYGLFENLALSANVPYVTITPDFGNEESGLGDVTLGLDLLAYEDIFHYPYVIPYLEVQLDTGDEKKGLGTGEKVYRMGVTVGTVVEDVVHFTAAVHYDIYTEFENVLGASGAIIWDLSDAFSVHVEGRVSEYRGINEDEIDAEYIGLAGMSFRPNEDTLLTLYGGSTENRAEDVITGLRVSYNF